MKGKKEDKRWYNQEGQLHREDGPAILYQDGTTEWYKNGKLHREDGPAVIIPDGARKWYKNGKIHREDGPAVIYQDGTEKWFIDGRIHRGNGPAIEYRNGNKEYWIMGNLHREVGPAMENEIFQAWFTDGKLHREDGPALIFYPKNNDIGWNDCPPFWWFYPYRLVSLIKKFDFHVVFTIKYGEQQWWKNGKLHREDGPAIIYQDGTQKYCYNGKLHRENFPAVIYPNGSVEWWKNGKLHNKSGPAVQVQEGYFIYNNYSGGVNRDQMKWDSFRKRRYYMERMSAIELPITEKKAEKEIVPLGSDNYEYKVSFIGNEFENHLNNEWWIKGKRIIRD